MRADQHYTYITLHTETTLVYACWVSSFDICALKVHAQIHSTKYEHSATSMRSDVTVAAQAVQHKTETTAGIRLQRIERTFVDKWWEGLQS